MVPEQEIVKREPDSVGVNRGPGPDGRKGLSESDSYLEFLLAQAEGGETFEDFRNDFLRNLGFRMADKEKMYELVMMYGKVLKEGTDDKQALIDGICQTINLQLKRDAAYHGYKQFYSKTGLMSNEFLREVLSNLQEKSMAGAYDDGKNHRLRAFVVNLDKDNVKKQGKDFYGKLASDIVSFTEKIPEYMNDVHVRKLLDEIRRDEPWAVYGDEFRWEYRWKDANGEKDGDILGPSALFKKDWNLISNFRGFTKTFMNGQTSEQLPLFLPVINLEWPENYGPKNYSRIWDALHSYAAKRVYVNDGGSLRKEKRGETTPFEEQMADEARYASGYFSTFATTCNRGPMILLGHSWFIGALPYDAEGASWCGSFLANDCFLTDLGDVARHDLIKII